MNKKDREKIRGRLLEERKERLELLADLDERFKTWMETGDDDLSHYPLHMADEGTDTINQEQQFLLASQEGRQLIEIDEALRRLYKTPDAFGQCEECGSEITTERLDIVPWATRCIACKRRAEAAIGGGPAA